MSHFLGRVNINRCICLSVCQIDFLIELGHTHTHIHTHRTRQGAKIKKQHMKLFAEEKDKRCCVFEWTEAGQNGDKQKELQFSDNQPRLPSCTSAYTDCLPLSTLPSLSPSHPLSVYISFSFFYLSLFSCSQSSVYPVFVFFYSFCLFLSSLRRRVGGGSSSSCLFTAVLL